MVSSKVSKILGLLRKLQNSVLRYALTILHKTFVKPHPDCGDVFYLCSSTYYALPSKNWNLFSIMPAWSLLVRY